MQKNLIADALSRVAVCSLDPLAANVVRTLDNNVLRTAQSKDFYCHYVLKRGCTEKPDTIKYTYTVRYKTYSREYLNTLARERYKDGWGGESLSLGCLNAPAREVFYIFLEEGEISLTRVFIHPSERVFPYLLGRGRNLSRSGVLPPQRERFNKYRKPLSPGCLNTFASTFCI